MRVDFVIAGAQKGGTTALASFLARHPQIFMAAPKELHFFDRSRYFHHGSPDYDWYHRHFEPAESEKVLGEATPSYLWWRPALRRMHRYHAGLKLVCVLRNPVERAYSHYRMNVERGVESRSFETALRLEPFRRARAFPRQSRRYSYVSRGFYSFQIERMFSFFPKEQALFLKNEQLRHAHDETLARVSGFLGVDHVRIPPAVVHSRDYDPMAPATRARLQHTYAGEIRRLEELLGWDCSDWREPDDAVQVAA